MTHAHESVAHSPRPSPWPALMHLAAASLLGSLGALTACSSSPQTGGTSVAPPAACWVYFSSNSVIKVARFDCTTGQISTPVITSAVPSTNWITIAPSGRFMYATASFPDKDQNSDAAGALATFSIDRTTGLLTLIGEQPSGGLDPAHIAVDPAGHGAVAANYGGGKVASLPIGPDGKLGLPQVIQHTGTSKDPSRQTQPHPHCVVFDQTGKFVYVPDLGTDKIVIYNFDPATAKLTPHDPPFQSVTPGMGPRHLTFDAAYKHAYLLAEMGSTLFVFDYNAATGNLTEKQHLSSLAPEFKGTSTAAEVLLSPNGKFLYASNRDQNGIGSIGTFAVDHDSGTLKPLTWTSTTGNIPRNFNLDPTGHWLLCGNQNSGKIVEFKVNPDTGALTLTDVSISLDSPFCIAFLPIEP